MSQIQTKMSPRAVSQSIWLVLRLSVTTAYFAVAAYSYFATTPKPWVMVTGLIVAGLVQITLGQIAPRRVCDHC